MLAPRLTRFNRIQNCAEKRKQYDWPFLHGPNVLGKLDIFWLKFSNYPEKRSYRKSCALISFFFFSLILSCTQSLIRLINVIKTIILFYVKHYKYVKHNFEGNHKNQYYFRFIKILNYKIFRFQCCIIVKKFLSEIVYKIYNIKIWKLFTNVLSKNNYNYDLLKFD